MAEQQMEMIEWEGKQVPVPVGLSDEQVVAYMAQHQPAAPSQPAFSPINAVGQMLRGAVVDPLAGAYETASKPASTLYGLLTDPVKTLTTQREDAAKPMSKQDIDAALKRFDSPASTSDKTQMAANILGELIPGIGPAFAGATQTALADNPGRGVGQMLAMLAGMRGGAGKQAVPAPKPSPSPTLGWSNSTTGMMPNTAAASTSGVGWNPNIGRMLEGGAQFTYGGPFSKLFGLLNIAKGASRTKGGAKSTVPASPSVPQPAPPVAAKPKPSAPIKPPPVSYPKRPVEQSAPKVAPPPVTYPGKGKPNLQPHEKLLKDAKKLQSLLAAPGWERLVRDSRGRFTRSPEDAVES